MDEKTEFEDMFGEDMDSTTIMATMAELAEFVAVLDDEIKTKEAVIKTQKAELDEAKRALYNALIANNCANGHTFDNGINVKPVLNIDYFKAAGTTDEDQQGWLQENELGDIIKPTVNWKTFSSTIKSFVEQGGSLPEIFHETQKPTTRFYGKGKKAFLESRN